MLIVIGVSAIMADRIPRLLIIVSILSLFIESPPSGLTNIDVKIANFVDSGGLIDDGLFSGSYSNFAIRYCVIIQ